MIVYTVDCTRERERESIGILSRLDRHRSSFSVTFEAPTVPVPARPESGVEAERGRRLRPRPDVSPNFIELPYLLFVATPWHDPWQHQTTALQSPEPETEDVPPLLFRRVARTPDQTETGSAPIGPSAPLYFSLFLARANIDLLNYSLERRSEAESRPPDVARGRAIPRATAVP